jgi:hypothetical protein
MAGMSWKMLRFPGKNPSGPLIIPFISERTHSGGNDANWAGFA